MIKKILFSVALAVGFQFTGNAQDLINLLGNQPSEKTFATATFKSTRIISTHSLETVGKNTLDFRISHRFGAINSGSYKWWGIDEPANIRLSLEYSYDGRLMVGVGRSSLEKMADGFLKFKLYRQTDDDAHPLSVTLFSGMYYTNLKDLNKEKNGFDKYEFMSSRLSYCYEIIAGRKFSPSFSFQVAPFFVHYNLVEKFTDKNDVYGVTAATRFKFSKRSAIVAEYCYRINKYTQSTYYNSMGIGYEIETGGHVFQVYLTNSFGMAENQFFAHTDSKWSDAGIRVGFNISRVFTIGGGKSDL
ncbi:MAG: DUF5777 family beta-barrel protein [Bacteroidetes bacterium]|nr:DUF5777 family beta-barrel protein [Bacteroidota bacterium]